MREINFLEQALTVMLLYWTTEVDDEGRVLFAVGRVRSGLVRHRCTAHALRPEPADPDGGSGWLLRQSFR